MKMHPCSAGTWEITLNLGRDAQGVRRRRSVTVQSQASHERKMRCAECGRDAANYCADGNSARTTTETTGS